MPTTRRELLSQAGRTAGILALPLLRPAAAEASPALDPALERRLAACAPAADPLLTLMDRNRRFCAAWQAASGTPSAAGRARRMHALWQASCQVDPGAMAEGQRPWAALLSCADSRVAPEWIFAAGAGELFDIRCAGNTAFDEGIASLEYAVLELAVPLILVLGHSGCGAVTAALGADPLTPLLERLVRPIRAALQNGDDLPEAIRHNTGHTAAQLVDRSAVLRQAVQAARLRIQPAVFDLASGQVELI